MLKLSRKKCQELYIYPSENLPLETTVAGLFKDGLVIILLDEINGNQVR